MGAYDCGRAHMADEESKPPKPQVPSWLTGTTAIIIGVTGLMGAGIGALNLYPEFVHSACEAVGAIRCGESVKSEEFDFADFSNTCGIDSGDKGTKFTTIACNGSLCVASEVKKPIEGWKDPESSMNSVFKISEVDVSVFKNDNGERFKNILQVTCADTLCMHVNGEAKAAQSLKFDSESCALKFRGYLDEHKKSLK